MRKSLIGVSIALLLTPRALADNAVGQTFEVEGVTLPTSGGITLLGVESEGAGMTLVVMASGRSVPDRRQVGDLLKEIPAGIGSVVVVVSRGDASAFSSASGNERISVQEVEPQAWGAALGRYGFPGSPGLLLVGANGVIAGQASGYQASSALAALAAASASAAAPLPKVTVFVLGFELQQAGCMAGVNVDVAKADRPGTIDLIKRNLQWGLDHAKGLGLPTDSIAKLQSDVDRVDFRDIGSRVEDPIEKEIQTTLREKDPIVSMVFVLGIHLGTACFHAGHVREFPRDQKPGTADLVRKNVTWLQTDLKNLNLGLSAEPLDRVLEAIDRGEPFATIEKQLGEVLELWQKELAGE